MADDILRGIQPRRGRLVPVRTHAEVHEGNLTLAEGVVVLLAPRDAQTALHRIDAMSPNTGLAHLRRIAKLKDLPKHVQAALDSAGVYGTLRSRSVSSASSASASSKSTASSRESKLSRIPPLALMAGPVDTFTDDILASVLAEIPHVTHTVSFPAHAPPDRASAIFWTAQHWPTAWRNHNPYGPQPLHWTREAERVEPHESGMILALAHTLGHELQQTKSGAGMGAVIIESDTGAVIAGAGDARWHLPSFADTNGNILAHAPMRALALLGRQRQRLDADTRPVKRQKTEAEEVSSIFEEIPLTTRETSIDAASELQPGGYLGMGLDVYLTHEPCVMCSMALIHSRVNAVVFGRRMQRTGGLAVEKSGDDEGQEGTGSGYGLWWRPELNWKILTWEFLEDAGDGGGGMAKEDERLDESLHA